MWCLSTEGKTFAEGQNRRSNGTRGPEGERRDDKEEPKTGPTVEDREGTDKGNYTKRQDLSREKRLV